MERDRLLPGVPAVCVGLKPQHEVSPDVKIRAAPKYRPSVHPTAEPCAAVTARLRNMMAVALERRSQHRKKLNR